MISNVPDFLMFQGTVQPIGHEPETWTGDGTCRPLDQELFSARVCCPTGSSGKGFVCQTLTHECFDSTFPRKKQLRIPGKDTEMQIPDDLLGPEGGDGSPKIALEPQTPRPLFGPRSSVGF